MSDIDRSNFNNKAHEIEKKLDLKNLKNRDKISPYYIGRNLSEKEILFINESQYANNNKNTLALIGGVSDAEYVNADLNNDDPSEAGSLHDFFNEVKNTIIIGKHDDLDILKDIFSKYMNYVNDLREALSNLSKYTKAGSKDGYVNVDFGSLRSDIEMIKNKYLNLFQNININFTKGEGDSYYRVINGEKIYYESSRSANETIDALAKILTEISGIHVRKENDAMLPDIGNTFILSLDFTELDKFINDLDERSKSRADILQTEFDLFKKALDALEKRINTNLDELSKKYSSANSNYDNFVKIVSSTMNTLLEMAKGFLRF
ncbi:IpaD/SipD/SspD family type III secretion system needle tip protein [Proteus columbae]|uniref:IpaD/SipD/SspD family type III secretion system needle tip protein n=1 Tax=Proteus columbae TaxID=1987580 RepID=UPI0012FFE622|nr:IpaD/SipD/SspD family type III secretion system needle tip protein [Proteus columbae]